MDRISLVLTKSGHFLIVPIILILFCFAFQVCPGVALGQPGSGFDAIDTYIKTGMQNARIPGLALAIVQEDKIIHMKGFGIAGPDGRQVTPQTPFLIGSVSKSFTALAIIQLKEAGKIDLDAPVQRYLPWFKIADEAASATISVRHLLNQTSGFPESAGQRTLADGYSGDDALEREIRSYQSIHPTHTAGSVMQYSNANFNILGMIVQAVSGQPYETYIQDHILDPLGMHNSFTSITEGRQYGLATGYRKWFGYSFPALNLPYPRGHIPSGYLISSAEDLAHYTIAQLNDGLFKGRSVLSPEGMALLQSPSAVELISYLFKAAGCDNKAGAHYAMGWWSLELNRIPVICHSGDTPDFHADVALIPEGKWGVIMLMNVSNKLMSEDIHGLITGVVSLVKGQPPIREQFDLVSRISFYFLIGMLIFEIAITVRAVFLLVSRPPAHAPGIAGNRSGGFRLYRPLLFSLVGSGLIIIGVPKAMGLSWQLMMLNQPDFTLMLIVLSLLILLRGALSFWHNFRT